MNVIKKYNITLILTLYKPEMFCEFGTTFGCFATRRNLDQTKLYTIRQ